MVSIDGFTLFELENDNDLPVKHCDCPVDYLLNTNDLPIEHLVGGLEHDLFVFHILGMSSSQLTNSNLFQRYVITTNQTLSSMI